MKDTHISLTQHSDLWDMLNNPFKATIDKGGSYIPQLSSWNQSVNIRECSKHSEGQYDGKEKVDKCWINFLECVLTSQSCFEWDLNVFATHWNTFLKIFKKRHFTFLAYLKLYWICDAKNGQKRILPKFRKNEVFSIFEIL